MAVAPSRTVVIGLIAGGVLGAICLALLLATSGSSETPILSGLFASWLIIPYVSAGAIAWRQRPESRLGTLMVVAGAVVFLSFLNWSNVSVLYTIGGAADLLPPALFLHVFLGYPTGRLESVADRVVVVCGYCVALLAPIGLVFGNGDTRNLLAIADQPETYMTFVSIELVAMSALLIVATTLLIGRRWRKGRPLRPTIGYLVNSFSLALLMLALLYLVQQFGWTTIAEPVRLIAFASIGLAPVVFLVGLLAVRLGQASVGELVVALGVNPGPAKLQEAVVHALRDPSARLAYWLPEFNSYADVDGRQLEMVETAGRSTTAIIRDGVMVAKLLHDSELEDEPQLLSSVASALGMTIENAKLQVELRARLEELRGSRTQILEAEQRARRRLERDLHDGAQQRLVSLSLRLGELTSGLGEDPELKDTIELARQEVTASLSELRDLARGIHPAAVSDYGLAVALESVATRSPIPVELIDEVGGRLPEPVELAAFYIVCEALANIAKHARASSSTVTLTRVYGNLVIEVTDDGVGGATADDGTGLRGLADRVEALDGRLQVWSPVGAGTRIRAELPCAL